MKHLMLAEFPMRLPRGPDVFARSLTRLLARSRASVDRRKQGELRGDWRTIRGTRPLFPRFVPRICDEESDGVLKGRKKNCLPECYARSAEYRAPLNLSSLFSPNTTLSTFSENERDSRILCRKKKKEMGDQGRG